MKSNYHNEITRLALEDQFSESVLTSIVQANTKQDRINLQIGHDHIHFDGSAFKSGFQYIAEQEQCLLNQIQIENFHHAWEALGRITHSWQDFFSHSNYVQLWVEKHQNKTAEAIGVNDPDILHHPSLSSGKSYIPIELLILVPGVKTLIKPIIPKDSHAYMNLDSPASGQFFYFAYWAALKATKAACERIFQLIDHVDPNGKLVKQFKGK